MDEKRKHINQFNLLTFEIHFQKHAWHNDNETK